VTERSTSSLAGGAAVLMPGCHVVARPRQEMSRQGGAIAVQAGSAKHTCRGCTGWC
jgi:hypothetical protein